MIIKNVRLIAHISINVANILVCYYYVTYGGHGAFKELIKILLSTIKQSSENTNIY